MDTFIDNNGKMFDLWVKSKINYINYKGIY